MAATADQIAQLRRMIAEAGTATYTDALLGTIIESYPVSDFNGHEQYLWKFGTQSGTDPLWIATYDLNAAAAQCWQEKAAAISANYDFSADGATVNRAQAFDHARSMSAHFAARMRPRAIRQQVYDQDSTSMQSITERLNVSITD